MGKKERKITKVYMSKHNRDICHRRCKSLDQYLRRLERFSLTNLYTRITTNRLVFWQLPCFCAETGRWWVQLQKSKQTFVFLCLDFLCFYMNGWICGIQFLNLKVLFLFYVGRGGCLCKSKVLLFGCETLPAYELFFTATERSIYRIENIILASLHLLSQKF